jgi:hypothetical protein
MKPSQKIPNGRHLCAKSPNSCPAKRSKTTGDKNPSKRPEVKKEISAINSVLFASGSPLREKCKHTLMEKYGVENPMSIPGLAEEFVKKRKQKGNYRLMVDHNDPKIKAKRLQTGILQGRIMDPMLKSPFARYKAEVGRLTELNYKKFKDIINPNDLTRGRINGTYQLDHILSKVEGFKLGVPPEILSHPANLRIIPMEQNISKSFRSHYTKEQLMEAIHDYDKKVINTR